MEGDSLRRKSEKTITQEKKNRRSLARNQSKIIHHTTHIPKPDITKSAESVPYDYSYDIAGIRDLTLLGHTQQLLKCVIGEHVTSEIPWIYVDKETIDDNLELHEESSDFLPIKDVIKEYTSDKVLIGYNATSLIENQFRICVTDEAQKSVKTILDAQKAAQEQKLKNAIHKRIGVWMSFGSEDDVNETIVKDMRSLIEVETVMTIGSIRAPALFSDRNVASVKNGYTTFREPRHLSDTIRRSRLSTGVQAVPATVPGEAQTVEPLPTNMSTQYEFPITIPDTLTETDIEKTLKLLEKHEAYLDSNLTYNEHFDVNKNDYAFLGDDDEDIHIPDKISFHELQSLSNVRKEDRVISCASWHPMWSGIVAVGYANMSINSVTRIEKDTGMPEFVETLPRKKCVLIWSMNDSLKPKLVLECSSEVHALEFCPHNENVLVGGCMNGSVIVWDISYKLNEAERVVMTSDLQKKYRRELLKLVGWKVDEENSPNVRPVAVSMPEFTHKMNVTKITWLNPLWKMTALGTWSTPAEEDVLAMQFVTSGRDGVVNFWDLNAPVETPSEYRKKKKKKDAEKEVVFLRHLEPYVSPYAALNKLFKPLFRIVVRDEKEDEEISFQLASMEFYTPRLEYKRREGLPAMNLTDRVKFFPVLEPPEGEPSTEFICGTTNGVLVQVRWEGVVFQPRIPLHHTISQIVARGVCHHGRVHAVLRSPFIADMLLTVTDEDFALWRTNRMQAPIFYRSSRIRLTAAMWSPHLPSMFYITKADGTLEVWDLLRHTERSIMTQRISSLSITGIYLHNLPMPRDLVGISDSGGTFRVFLIPSAFLKSSPNDIDALNAFFQHDLERRQEIKEWQDTWLAANEEAIREQQERAKEQLRLDEEAKMEKKRVAAEELRAYEANLMKIKAMAKRSKDSNTRAKGQQKWEEMEKERMTKAILAKKRLDTEDLMKKQRPLRYVKERKQKVAEKIEETFREKENVFKETITTLFPEVAEKEDVDTHEDTTHTDGLEKVFAKQYEQRRVKVQELLETDPMPKSRDWKTLLNEGIERKNSLTMGRPDNMEWRRERYERRRDVWLAEAAARGDDILESFVGDEDLDVPIVWSDNADAED